MSLWMNYLLILPEVFFFCVSALALVSLISYLGVHNPNSPVHLFMPLRTYFKRDYELLVFLKTVSEA